METSFKNWLCPDFLSLPKKSELPKLLGGLQPPSPPRPVRLCPWLIWWLVTAQFCWITLHFNLTGRGWKEEKMARGAGGRTIIRGRRLIEGRLLFQGIRYMRLAWAPLAGILILRSPLIISTKQTIPPINYLYIPLPSNRALELVCNSHILPE